MNIYNLYVTRSRDERNYFYKTIEFIKKTTLKQIRVVIIHLDFKWDETVLNMKEFNQRMLANVYVFENNKLDTHKVIINNLNDLIGCFRSFEQIISNKNMFMYSGHSDGLYFRNKHINILRIEDFCEIIKGVLNKKADIVIFDCCLCGNINCLSICRNYCNYVIASTSYWSYMSVLDTHSIYLDNDNTPEYCKNIVKEMINLEHIEKGVFITDYALYEMNGYLDNFINKVLFYKDHFDLKSSYVLDYAYYKDIECEFRELNIHIDTSGFILFQRLPVKKCHSKKNKKNANSSWASKLLIILNRKNNKQTIPTKGDIFFKK